MTLKEMIEVLQAAERGEKIEFRHKDSRDSRWHEMALCEFNFYAVEYRIAPKREPKMVKHWPVVYMCDGVFHVSTQLYVVTPVGFDSRLATEYPPIMLPENE